MGHLKLLKRAANGEVDLHRSKENILSDKESKNSTAWFKKSDIPYKSVPFVPATPGSVLANAIRDVEKQNRQGRKSRVKIVEQSGSTVRNILAKNYPWEFSECSDPECFPCSSGGTSKKISCRRPGVGYKIYCNICKDAGALATYQGESGRNLYSRGKEHLQGLSAGTTSNCLVIHNNVHHGGSKDANFTMVPTRTFNDPLSRQVDESMRLKYQDKSTIVMNSGNEWRGDSIPRARFSAPGLEARRRKN